MAVTDRKHYVTLVISKEPIKGIKIPEEGMHIQHLIVNEELDIDCQGSDTVVKPKIVQHLCKGSSPPFFGRGISAGPAIINWLGHLLRSFVYQPYYQKVENKEAQKAEEKTK
jgi:hypothetical protein